MNRATTMTAGGLAKRALVLSALLLAAACGRTPVEPGPCAGEACPCVFDADCAEGELCVDAVCIEREAYLRCLAEGARPETCNGLDDDCDGRTDEGLGERPCARAAEGRMCTGVERCEGSAGWICDALAPRDELCDGLDDDCDGRVDDPFVDAEGRYASVEHCGACNRNCDTLLSEALETACVESEAGFRCEVRACPAGLYVSADRTRCAALPDPICRACQTDADCPGPGVRCLELAEGERACGRDCGPGSPWGSSCPAGFSCAEGQCAPDAGTCLCTEAQLGATRSCTVEPVCEGIQTCERQGAGFAWSACDISATRETCDGLDNDCDGVVDDGFVDAEGRYVSDLHCGICNQDCTRQLVESVDRAIGECDGSRAVPECVIARCTEEVVGGQRFEWVDVNGEVDDGCECRRRAGNSTFDPPDVPPVPGVPAVFQDENCDGVDGVVGDAIFVSASAVPGGDGSRSRPLTTLAGGLAALRRDPARRYVLAAEGLYAESITLREGDALHGGYATDFASRDVVRFATVIRAPDPGAGSLRASGVGRARVTGVELRAPDVNASPADGAPGRATVAARFEDVGPGVELLGSVVRGGRAGAGGRGTPGIEGTGRRSEPRLDGRDGQDGERRPGTCAGGTTVAGGSGGVNPSCGSRGRAGGSTGCPVFDWDVTPPRGEQAPHRSPTSGGDGAGGFHWSFDRLSGPSCSHLTESGFPSDVQDNNGLDGADGADGSDGADALGCRAAFGSLLNGSWVGRVAPSGARGIPGTPGGGGGGGGGTARFFRGPMDCRSHEIGGTGGGGGAGGCGGGGGAGGRSGGASIGVLVLGTGGPTLRGNLFERGRGGAGGDGGFGGSGGAGGRGGFGGQPTSWSGSEGGKGGDGGNGGRGGAGGGGCGGPSFGVLAFGFEGSSYASDNTFSTPADAELGGSGGAGASRGEDGASRQLLEVLPCGPGGSCPAGAACDDLGACLPAAGVGP